MEDLLSTIGKLNNTSRQRTFEVLNNTINTIKEMLLDRGCIISFSCNTMQDIQRCMVDGKKVISAYRSDKTTDVFFHNEERVGVKQIRAWIENMECDSIIVVSLEGPTAFTRKEVENNRSSVQFFSYRDLCVNITRHCLVPQHTKVNLSDIPIHIKDPNVELPILFSNDKIVQYYDFRIGDIIRITRTFGVQEPVYFWRIVRATSNA